MKLAACALAFAGALVARGDPARAAEPSAATPTPIDGFGEDVADAFSGTNLLYYGGAIAVTGAMAFGGGDHAVRVFLQKNLGAAAWGDTAYWLGYAIPVVFAPVFYVITLAENDQVAIGAASAALQALGVTVATTAILKWATGRPYPLHGGDPNAPDRLDHPEYARELHPFRLDGGWAWPSGHTSASTSIAAALTAYAPEERWIPIVGYPIALGIGIGMVVGDRHWMSDVVAGALFGQAIGWSIGRAFRRRVRGAREEAAWTIVPDPANGGARVAWSW